MYRKMLILLPAFLLAACGEGTGTPASDNTDDEHPLDTIPPAATVVSDADGFLDPTDTLSVEFNEAIDPASIPAELALVNLASGYELPLATQYSESTRTLTLSPMGPLPEDEAFALNLNGIADEAGNAIGSAGALDESNNKAQSAPLPIIIRSRPQLRATSLVYDTHTGDVNHAWRYTYHETGKVWRVVEYLSGPGLDGEWLDGNDEIKLMFVDELLTGTSHTRTWFDGPGMNGIWDAGLDDEIKEKSLYNDPGLESYVSSSDPGLDGDWFTGDDVYSLVHMRKFDPATRQLIYLFGNKQTENLGPGEDEDWFTSDDRIEYYTVTHYDENLRPVRTDYFRAGSDGLWFTGHDKLYSRSETTLDERGRIHTVIGSILKTSTDTGLTPHPYYVRHDYEGESRWYLRRVNLETGQDIAPGGGDDIVTGYTLFERDAEGNILRNGVFGWYGGPDGIWFNGDDSSSNLAEFVRNENKQVIAIWHYDGLGVDDLRFTGDETVGSLSKYERDAKGRLVKSYYYVDAGDDGDWGSPDDVLMFEDTYYTGPINNGE